MIYPLPDSLDVLRGYEQTATTLYFQALGSLFTDAFSFDKQTQHQQLTPSTACLSLGYTLLNQNIYSFAAKCWVALSFWESAHPPRPSSGISR
jgi:CRISPR-associated protein Cas1